ncbi:MAG: TlpA family protein disulfide reductase [Devosia sp.]|uniref:TlpA family protein disulfide reductase n=1 Tax=Devosia sp. TaxID=1871048 RepID=UPI001AC6AFE2|nr:TlpA disulfide reductase family protein [Devosia sp.]MBN9318013.1 TlpA family protein disulfide reductase [Devosia sp.]
MKHSFLMLVAAIATAAVPVSAAEPARQFALHDTPVPVPDINFADEAGASRSLADFRGKVVVLNVWATWCVPCRIEMPTLDRLQAKLGGPDFEVIALSIDRGGPKVVRRFFDEIGIQHLAVSIDTSTGAAFELGTVGLPATLLIDRDGMEIGRVIGPTDWDSEEMVSTLKSLIAAEPAQPTQ